MEKVFVGLIDGLHDDPRVMMCARAIFDFIYLAHYPSHSLSTLRQMRDALETFHSNKQVFVELGAREHFNIPKLHWIQHYVAAIYNLGTCDGHSTEVPERLHIDCAKMGYRASNRRGYIKQMIAWLTRREKVDRFAAFLRWCDSQSHGHQHAAELAQHPPGIPSSFDMPESTPDDDDLGKDTNSLVLRYQWSDEPFQLGSLCHSHSHDGAASH